MTLEDFARSFLARCEPDPKSECILWTGADDGRGGYGRTRVPRDISDHLAAPSGKTAAHRASYLLFRGRFNHLFQLDHICGRRKCVNPYHLQVVTAEENARRANHARWHAQDRPHWTARELSEWRAQGDAILEETAF